MLPAVRYATSLGNLFLVESTLFKANTSQIFKRCEEITVTDAKPQGACPVTAVTLCRAGCTALILTLFISMFSLTIRNAGQRSVTEAEIV